MFSHAVMSDLLWPHELKHARLPCPSQVYSNSCPLSQWCYPIISPTVVPFCYCLLFVLTSVSFPMSQLFTWGGQSIGTVASVLLTNIQDWFPLGLMIWSPCSPRDSQEFSPSPQFKSINSLVFSLFYGPTLTFMQSTRKTIDLTGWTFIRKVISLLFNMLSRFVIAFLPKSKCL